MKIRVFVGTGGVGKTSVAAAHALGGAALGEKCLVLTIDPALRLRSALGLTGDGLERRVDAGPLAPPGELWAGLLDVKATLDRAVNLYGEPEQARTVLAHPVYQVLIQSLAGMQELMAIERIDQAFKDGFRHLYIDTAPSRHAFEFLDKPEFFAELVSIPAVRLMGRTYKWWEQSAFSRLGKKSVELYSKMEQVLGSSLVRQVLDFYSVFRTIAEGYADRARETVRLLRDPSVSSFSIVTTPFKAKRDAGYFLAELGKRRYPVTSIFVNRVWLSSTPVAGTLPPAAHGLAEWCRGIGAEHARELDDVRAGFSSRIPSIVALRERPSQVDGLESLRAIAKDLGFF
jgi:anion-transporting  ArsA/GET3 family ATPase